ncbi:MAG: DUF4118 domain-containing protein [Eubacteriales bacterium]|nr:DUF4118 domain-containing protein [Eubacteriales bacterium]
MDDIRQDADELLKTIQGEQSRKSRGHFKIFFGYAAGVGKTYAMLKAAHAAKKRNTDVVVGYIEAHDQPQTTALLKGLEQIPPGKAEHNSIEFNEFDLDAAIARHPQLIIVDELAHTNAFRSTFTALFVETPDFPSLNKDDKNRLRANMRLAQQLGAKIETVYGDDVPYQIAEFARISGVSKIVIGRNSATRRHFFGKPSLTERLIAAAPNLDIHVIPDVSWTVSNYRAAKSKRKSNESFSVSDILKSVGILIADSLIGVIFDRLGFSEGNIITVYILGVVVTSVVTQNRIYSLISSVVSVFVFNFLFTAPRFTFIAYDSGYIITFIVMFAAALITGSLSVRLKSHAKQAAQAAFRTKVLFDTNQLLQRASDRNELISVTANQLVKLLDKDIIVYPANAEKLEEPRIFTVNEGAIPDECASEKERSVAEWVFRNNKHAGATTDTLADSKCLYLSIRINQQVYGVVGIFIDGTPLDAFENSIMLSILGESDLAMENEKSTKEKEEAAILVRNEQHRAILAPQAVKPV